MFWRDALERDVAAGEFPRLGSVLVADGGELVYERYFEGDAETRRDTRSATKTIASMLVPATTTRRLGEPVLSVD